jgi:hypothetical protein
MKYFAKYLSVEGEIKKGDKIQYHGIDGSFRPNIIEVKNEEHARYAEDRLWKKVKLFLCSRDVQVGDKFDQLPYGNGKAYECKEILGTFLKDDEGKNRVAQFCYKVIGEISPDATWVKEGDEFDKDETIDFLTLGNTDDNFGNWIPNGIYLIKGLCGHFH